MSSDSAYSAPFAGPRRDSFIAVESHAKGTVVWAQDHGFTSGSRFDLLLLDDAVVMAGGPTVAVFSSEGKKAWSMKKRSGSPCAIANGRVYYETTGMALQAVDAAGKVILKDGPLPGVVSPDDQLALLWPRADDFIMAADTPDPKYDEEAVGDNVVEPSITASRCSYGSRIGKVNQVFPGVVTLQPLYVPEKGRWLVGQKRIEVADLTDAESASRVEHFAMPMAKGKMWSADHDGTIVIAGLDEKERKDIVATDLAGRELWHWVDRDDSDTWDIFQPPIRAPKKRVLLLTSRRVLAFDAGKIFWQLDLVEEAKRNGARVNAAGTLVDKDDKAVVLDKPMYGTALADGSLLFAASATLRKIDATGHVVFAVKVGADIMSPPVVAADGAIYVATTTQLVQIK